MSIAAEDICAEDIAHALSLLCRGGGHLKYFYSVAQHSLNCMKEAKARGWSDRTQLACLLHDSSEAYLSDIIRPVKEHLRDYHKIEKNITDKIFEYFDLKDLGDEESKKWKQIDDEILEYELKNLMNGQENRPAFKLYSNPDIEEKSWKEVEKEFLDAVYSLMKKGRDCGVLSDF